MNERIQNDPRLQVGSINTDSLPSLPIGIVKKIGETVYVIAIDDAVFETDGAHFSAYMALDFPGADRKLAFAAENVHFNPSGVLAGEGAKLSLVSDVTLHLGPKVDLFLRGDGSSYVEFDCNGYKRTRLKGEFRFNGDLLQPTTPGATYVTALVDVYVQDIKNLYASVSFSPFEIRGLKDYEFTVSDASVDLSDFQNPNVSLPVSFQAALGGNQDLWRGFYLKTLSVKMPEKFNSKTGGRTEMGVNNLFIDDSGITGDVFATNVLNTNKGNMSGWGFSVSRVELNVLSNALIGGSLEGQVTIAPLDDNSLNYTATVAADGPDDVDYTFSVGLSSNKTISVPSLKSSITIYPTTVLTVTDNNAQDKFVPSMVLNGKITVDDGTAKIANLDFTNVSVGISKPFISGGTFALTTSGASLVNLPISINNVTLTFSSTTQRIALGFQVGITLGDASSSVSFSATTGVVVEANTNFAGNDGFHIKFHTVRISDIYLNVSTTPFYLEGYIAIRRDDPVFGNLFFGSINFKLNNIMNQPIILRAGFGKTSGSSGYKYWFVDGQVPVNIPLGQIALNKLIGGASYHVQSTLSNSSMISKVSGQLDPNAAIPFTPNSAYGLAFKAGVGFRHSTSEEIVNGDAVFQVSFNAGGGLAQIDFLGNCFMLVKTTDRYNQSIQNKIFGTISAQYNNNTKTFHTNISATAQFGGAIEGSLSVTFHIEPSVWYIWFNRPSSRATLSVKSGSTTLFTASSYLQFGTQIDNFPSLPSWAYSISGVSQTRNLDATKASTGNGLLTGMRVNVDLGRNYLVHSGSKSDYYVFLDIFLDFGFDLMVIKYPSHAVCTQTNSGFGMNQRYCTGQMYFKGDVAAGGKRIKRSNNNTTSLKLFDIQLLALLQGKFPKPTFVEGNFSAKVKFLGINIGTYNFKFNLGTQCTISY
ncbi:MAG: hypothetical protein EP338_03695 [Bacteroidetes bacterium]|nr:MAG: hypothetical protein EP338_03695 [Bacteroidota bacterium]